MISITLNQTDVYVGDAIGGTAIWQPDRDKSPRAIVIAAAWRTEGRGDKSYGHAGELRIPAEPGGAPLTLPLPFEFRIPAAGPISYDGKIIRIIWEITVRVDLPLAFDERAAEPFRVHARQL